MGPGQRTDGQTGPGPSRSSPLPWLWLQATPTAENKGLGGGAAPSWGAGNTRPLLTQTPAGHGASAPPAGTAAQPPPRHAAASGSPRPSARPTTWPRGLCLRGAGVGRLPEAQPRCSPGGAAAELGGAGAPGAGAGGSPVVAAMLELMEKPQAGAPAKSEQLWSSCRYPRASENSLWRKRRLALRPVAAVLRRPWPPPLPPEQPDLPALSLPGKLPGRPTQGGTDTPKAAQQVEVARCWPPPHGPGHSQSPALPWREPALGGGGAGPLTCPHQPLQGWDWAEPHNSVLAPGDVRGTAESPGPRGPLWGGVGERGGRRAPPRLHIHLSTPAALSWARGWDR